MTFDYASANGGNIGGLANSSTVAEILDSTNSSSIANDTGFNPTTLEGGSAVDLANFSSAYANNLGSAANVEGGVVNGVPLTNDVPIVDASNSVGDGGVFVDSTSNLFQIDGIPDATFFADLFGLGGAAAFTTAWTDRGPFAGRDPRQRGQRRHDVDQTTPGPVPGLPFCQMLGCAKLSSQGTPMTSSTSQIQPAFARQDGRTRPVHSQIIKAPTTPSDESRNRR